METTTSEQHFDFETLKERLDNDVDLILHLLKLTKEYLIDFVPSLDQLILDKNKAGIKSLAHKIKGTCVSVCLEEMAILAKQLENLDNFEDKTFIDLRTAIQTEADYLVNMIDTMK